MTMKKEMMSWLMTAMRQLVFSVVLCGACVCTSCSSDDDDRLSDVNRCLASVYR